MSESDRWERAMTQGRHTGMARICPHTLWQFSARPRAVWEPRLLPLALYGLHPALSRQEK